MNRAIFAIRDDKVGGFVQAPFTSFNGASAVRDVRELVNGSGPQGREHPFCKHPGDFTLFELGQWNEETGAITPVDGGKRIVASLIDLKDSEVSDE